MTETAVLPGERDSAGRRHVAREAIAGVTTFFTMAYIVVVNPSILATEDTGIAFSGALTATVLVCFTMTLLMGLYARLPFAVAPGMGINGLGIPGGRGHFERHARGLAGAAAVNVLLEEAQDFRPPLGFRGFGVGDLLALREDEGVGKVYLGTLASS